MLRTTIFSTILLSSIIHTPVTQAAGGMLGASSGEVIAFSAGTGVLPNFHSEEVVKNIPVVLQLSTETVQLLSDGNRIVQKEETLLSRDSEGRIRRETKLSSMADSVSISLFDPVKKKTIILDPRNKIAFETPNLQALINGTEIISGVTDENGPHMSPPVAVSVSEMGLSQGFELSGSVMVGAGGIGSMADAGMVIDHSPFLSITPVVKPLGQDKISGIRVEGTAYTTTYPANTFGNERAIIVEKETWYAPELRMMLRSVLKDPRMGTMTYSVKVLSQDDPDSALFIIPSDYKYMGSKVK